ncbi:MAG: DNA polymerase I [bacterium ADurb.Bin270]|nr:MAG: DNA polymerase I [bacterium ADurb.Bin270]
MAKKRLYLIDGSNYLFRAFYAIPRLTNSKGFPTNALHGFAKMLLKLQKEGKPEYMAVCFDRPEPTFRDGIFENYKANRQAPPEDLEKQFPYMRPLVEALGLKGVDLPGYEADDIIGTLAKKYASDDTEVVIVSGDKDMMQLIGPNVIMYDGMKDKWVGDKEVIEKFGVAPEGVVEVLGLAGDSSDNVPGISGVGPKTASKLIREYGSIEKVIENAERIGGSLGKKLLDGAELARISLSLVRIATDAPLDIQLKDLVPKRMGGEQAVAFFKELEFSGLLTELGENTFESTISFEKYFTVTEEKALIKLCNSLKNKEYLSIDLETTSLDPIDAKIVGFSLSWEAGEAAYLPIGHLPSAPSNPCDQGPLFEISDPPAQLTIEEIKRHLGPLLAEPSLPLIGQNLNYDLTVLKQHGFQYAGVHFDTMIASYLIDPLGEHDLDSLAEKYLEHRMIRYEDVVGKGKSEICFSRVPIDSARDYACEDADVALRLFHIFRKEIKEKCRDLFNKIEMPLIDPLVDMQIAGVKVDSGKLARIGADFANKLGSLEKKIFELAGEEFNVNSTKQLGVILFEKLSLKGSKKTKTGYSTSQEILEELSSQHELPGKVLEYRTLSKLKSTYVDALPQLIYKRSGRIHTSFNQARTATGRLSSSDPNLQNIPVRGEEGRRIREAFVAEKGFKLLSADYSQIELRVLAHMSGDENLLQAFAEGLDVHAITASGIFGVRVRDVTREQRTVGKTVNFATIYGQGAFGLSKQLGISAGEAASYIENYFKKYPAVAKYRELVLYEAKNRGYVETLFGRRRPVGELSSQNRMAVQIAERVAFNTVFQGTAADIIKIAMIDIHAGIGDISKGAKMIVQVHDELLFEVPDGDCEVLKSFVVSKMEGAAQLKVPLVVDVGIADNWAEAH